MQRETAITILLLFTIPPTAMLTIGMGCGNPQPSTEVTYCCTRGDAAGAYFTAQMDCPAGYRCIAPNDVANAALYRTCSGGPTLPRPGQPVAVRRSCLAECPPGARSANCITSATPPPHAAALQRLAMSLMQNRNLRIDLAAVNATFAIAGNPLNRGPILVENERLLNSGRGASIFTALVPGLGAVARFELSPALEASIERLPNNGGIILRPISAAKGASIRLLQTPAGPPHQFDAAGAGRILAAETDGQRIYFQTPTACVGSTLMAAAGGGPSKQ